MKIKLLRGHTLEELEKQIDLFYEDKLKIEGTPISIHTISIQEVIGDYGEKWFNAFAVYESI